MKICAQCGKGVAGREAIEDSAGQYLCGGCWEVSHTGEVRPVPVRREAVVYRNQGSALKTRHINPRIYSGAGINKLHIYGFYFVCAIALVSAGINVGLMASRRGDVAGIVKAGNVPTQAAAIEESEERVGGKRFIRAGFAISKLPRVKTAVDEPMDLVEEPNDEMEEEFAAEVNEPLDRLKDENDTQQRAVAMNEPCEVEEQKGMPQEEWASREAVNPQYDTTVTYQEEEMDNEPVYVQRQTDDGQGQWVSSGPYVTDSFVGEVKTTYVVEELPGEEEEAENFTEEFQPMGVWVSTGAWVPNNNRQREQCRDEIHKHRGHEREGEECGKIERHGKAAVIRNGKQKGENIGTAKRKMERVNLWKDNPRNVRFVREKPVINAKRLKGDFGKTVQPNDKGRKHKDGERDKESPTRTGGRKIIARAHLQQACDK